MLDELYFSLKTRTFSKEDFVKLGVCICHFKYIKTTKETL